LHWSSYGLYKQATVGDCSASQGAAEAPHAASAASGWGIFGGGGSGGGVFSGGVISGWRGDRLEAWRDHNGLSTSAARRAYVVTL